MTATPHPANKPSEQPEPGSALVSPRGRPARFFNATVQDEARRLRWHQHRSVTAIAHRLGCSPSTVWALLKSIDTPTAVYRYVLPGNAVQRYTNGEPVESIAAEIGCRPTTALRMLARAGANVPTDADIRADIVTRYTRHGQSIRAIAAGLHRSYGYVRRHLTLAGVVMRPRGQHHRPHKPGHKPRRHPSH